MKIARILLAVVIMTLVSACATTKPHVSASVQQLEVPHEGGY